MIIIVTVVYTKGQKWLIRLRMKDMPVKKHDSREEISANVPRTQLTG